MTPVVATTVQRMWWADGGLHAAGEDEELADEAVQHGEADEARAVRTKKVTIQGRFGGEAAEVAHVVGAVALVEEAEEEEEGGAGEGFVEDLEDAAVEAGDGEGEDAEDDEAERR